MTTARAISVILPVHDEAQHVASLVEQHVRTLASLPIPVTFLLVPNGCTDASPELCARLAEAHPGVTVVSCPRGGWGAAVRRGIAAAEGDLICYTNLARTTPQHLALILLYAIVFPNAVIKARRSLRESWPRRIGSWLYNLECRALFDLSHGDVNGTPKVFPRSFERLLHLRQEGDLIDAELCAQARRHGYPVIEVPVEAARRHSGRSTTSYRSALRMYLGALTLARRLER